MEGIGRLVVADAIVDPIARFLRAASAPPTPPTRMQPAAPSPSQCRSRGSGSPGQGARALPCRREC